jgi:hypothetical protein
MRSGSAILKKQWKGDYYTMVEDLTFYDVERRCNAELNPLSLQKSEPSRKSTAPIRATTPTRVGYSTARVSASGASPFVRRSETPSAPLPERQRSSAPLSGSCHQCGKPGHYKDQCPQNPAIKAIDGLESEEEEAWEESKEV